jgi:hypothetical protein
MDSAVIDHFRETDELRAVERADIKQGSLEHGVEIDGGIHRACIEEQGVQVSGFNRRRNPIDDSSVHRHQATGLSLCSSVAFTEVNDAGRMNEFSVDDTSSA